MDEKIVGYVQCPTQLNVAGMGQYRQVTMCPNPGVVYEVSGSLLSICSGSMRGGHKHELSESYFLNFRVTGSVL